MSGAFEPALDTVGATLGEEPDLVEAAEELLTVTDWVVFCFASPPAGAAVRSVLDVEVVGLELGVTAPCAPDWVIFAKSFAIASASR